jgi:hypothetical protein
MSKTWVLLAGLVMATTVTAPPGAAITGDYVEDFEQPFVGLAEQSEPRWLGRLMEPPPPALQHRPDPTRPSTSRTTTLPSTESRTPYRSGREPVTVQLSFGVRDISRTRGGNCRGSHVDGRPVHGT